MRKRQPLVYCQNVLLIAWAIGSLVPFAIIYVQTLNGYYDGREKEAWDWILARVAPTITLMIGAAIQTRTEASVREREVDSFLFHLSIGATVVYFAGIYAVLLFGYGGPLRAMQASGLFLTFIQGILSTLLGFFFLSAKRPDRARKGN